MLSQRDENMIGEYDLFLKMQDISDLDGMPYQVSGILQSSHVKQTKRYSGLYRLYPQG